MKEKNIKEKKKKQKVSKILSNNIFMLKLIWKAAPLYIPISVFLTIAWPFLNFLQSSYMLRYVINGVQEGKTFGALAPFVIIITVVIILTQGFSTLWWNVGSKKMEFKISKKIDSMLFEKAVKVDLECFETPEFFDTYIKATNASSNKALEVLRSLNNLLSCIVTVSANSFLIFTIDPVLILFALAPLPFSVFIKKARKLRFDRNMKTTENDRQMSYSMRSFYLNDFAKEMRLLDMYKVMFKQFTDAYKQVKIYYKQYGVKMAIFWFISYIGNSMISNFGATIYAIWQTLGTGRMMYGDCLVVVNSISQVSWIVSSWVSRITDFIEHSLYIENLREFLSYEEKIKDGETEPSRGVLKLENVSFTYGKNEKVLENINMEIKPGEKIALVGHNGAGKSTLVKLFLRLYDPCEGTVTFGGRNIKEYKLFPYRFKFSVVFQDFAKFSLSAKDNILLRPSTDKETQLVLDALKQSGGYDIVQGLEHGLDTTLTREFDEQGAVLSGGEYQKLSLARIFTEDSDFVILDEPSSALDPIAEYKMYENMMQGCKDKAIIFISHRLSSAVLADKIYMIENGRIIEEGTHKDLVAAKGKYAEMFEKQAKSYKNCNEEVTA